MSAIQRQEGSESDLTYDHFINGVGKQFEKANRARNWLGEDVVQSVPLDSLGIKAFDNHP